MTERISLRSLNQCYTSILLVYLGYPGILMFATVRVFKVSTRMGTIKNKMAEGFLETKIFRNAHTDMRAQL